MTDIPLAVGFTDKPVRSADPGRTAGLRKAFRAAGLLNLRRLRAGLRQAVVDFNVLGLSGAETHGGLMAPGARLQQFAGWLESAAHAALDARWWVHPWLERAIQHGLRAASAEIVGGVGYQPVPTTFDGLHQLAVHEMQGIVATIVQKLTRQAHSAMARNLKPHQAFRELVVPLDGEIRRRLAMFTQAMVVKSHVHGKVACYRAHGITRVGIDPELRRVRPDGLMHDAVRRRRKKVKPKAKQEFAEVAWVNQVHGEAPVCDRCEEMAADSPYTLEEVMDLIPLHPHCQCDLVIWDEPEEEVGSGSSGRRRRR